MPDTLYGMSEKGWTDQELFYYWLTEQFIKHIPPTRPVIQLVDGHSSHYECGISFGVYEDDLIDGELSQEWIQCTNDRCEKWMHVECLSTNDDRLYVCQVCNNTFA